MSFSAAVFSFVRRGIGGGNVTQIDEKRGGGFRVLDGRHLLFEESYKIGD